MSACSPNNEYASSPPPGFTCNNLTLKRTQLIELLKKVLDKYEHESQFVEQHLKQTDLLFSTAQYILLPTSISNDDQHNFLNNIKSTVEDLLSNDNQSNDEQIIPSDNSVPPFNETNNEMSTVPDAPNADFSLDNLANEYLQNEQLPSCEAERSNELEKSNITLGNTNDEVVGVSNETTDDFSLESLANEYLRNEPLVSTSSEKSNKLEESDSTLNDVNLTKPTESILKKSLFERILFSNRLSSNDAADDADCIWKKESSVFGQILCTKSNEIPTVVSKRISTCLFDRSLYERLTNLINLLPKQCIRNNVQQISNRPNNTQQNRTQRPNNDNRRPNNCRPTFQQNSSQGFQNQRYPSSQNPRAHSNFNYSNQQNNFDGNFVDRRSQQQQQQQINRYPMNSSTYQQHSGDYQGKNRTKTNHNNDYQSQKKTPTTTRFKKT